MTDNLEQLEKDWPTRWLKDIPSVKLSMGFAIFFTVLAALYAVLQILGARRHHADFLYVAALDLILGVLLPWVAAIGAYRRLRTALAASGASPDVLLAIRRQGVTAL
jgi:hypothetical protein